MKPKKYKSLTQYLGYYYQYCQKNMVLVYRGDTSENWARRCTYLGPKYHPKVPYNHRSILDYEVVIEYDYDDTDLNVRLVDRVIKKLNLDGIKYAKWNSGNKSSHLHVLIRQIEVANLALLKKTFMRHYGTFYYDKNTKRIYDDDCVGREKLIPDLKLATSNHLIRAEYGVHEKTQNIKTLIYKSHEYPILSSIPVKVFEMYVKAEERSVRQRMSQSTIDLVEHPIVKKLLDTVYFRDDMDDGRERIMYQLVHVLKRKYKPRGAQGKEELVNFLWEWYKYSSSQGLKMSKQDVYEKVRYHWNRDYTITEATLKRTIEEVGGTT